MFQYRSASSSGSSLLIDLDDVISLSEDEVEPSAGSSIPPNAQEIDLTGYYDLIESELDGDSPGYSTPQTPGRRSVPGSATRNSPLDLPFVEKTSCYLRDGTSITVNDTAELQSDAELLPKGNHSGDFLRVRHIIKNLQTDELLLRGHRLRRAKYLAPIFDWKLNEVVMLLDADALDPTSPFLQGLEDIAAEQAIRKRGLTITNEPDSMDAQYSFRNTALFQDMLEKATELKEEMLDQVVEFTEENKKQINEEVNKIMREEIFDRHQLVCRTVQVSVWQTEAQRRSEDRMPYAGEIRNIYAQEADPDAVWKSCVEENDTNPKCTEPNPPGSRRRARSNSVEIVNGFQPRTKQASFRHKMPKYTFADAFHGAGGASRGAVMANLKVVWGFDHNELACEAYKPNFPDAASFKMEASDFAQMPIDALHLQVDILHLSPPCCFFSPAHTRPGPHDQANYDAIFTVGALISKARPRIVTLEQTFGLVTFKQHRKTFKRLLNDIITAGDGYKLRYKIVDCAEYGLVQKRLRLIIIAARLDVPLPNFPKPTHGAPGTGLKPFTTVWDALEPIRSKPNRWDPYHEPDLKHVVRGTWSNPKLPLRGCITTGGGENIHYDGLRRYTVRELSLFQSFPMKHIFTGSPTDAQRQVGNAFPPVVARAVFTECIRTLEAFDSGLIGAEVSPSDLESMPTVKAEATTEATSSPSTRTTSLSTRHSNRVVSLPRSVSARNCSRSWTGDMEIIDLTG